MELRFCEIEQEIPQEKLSTNEQIYKRIQGDEADISIPIILLMVAVSIRIVIDMGRKSFI